MARILWTTCSLLALILLVDAEGRWPSLVCGEDGSYGLDPKLLTEVYEKCGDAKERGICQFTCNFPVVDLFNSEGFTTMEIFEDYNKAVVPVQYQEMARGVWQSCFDKYGPEVSEAKVGCANAVAFDDCTMVAFQRMTC